MKQVSAKIVNASVVTGDGVSVPDAEILSKGERNSSGVLLVDEKGAKYLAIPIEDIGDLKGFCDSLTGIVELISKVAASQGITPEAANPQILTEIQNLKTKLGEFKQT